MPRKPLSGSLSYVIQGNCSLVQILNLEIVVPLREVEVAFVPFDLAALEINGIAARIFLLGIEIAAEIGVDHHSVWLDAAEEEVAYGKKVNETTSLQVNESIDKSTSQRADDSKSRKFEDSKIR